MKFIITLLSFGVFVSAIEQRNTKLAEVSLPGYSTNHVTLHVIIGDNPVKYQLPPERVERVRKAGDKCAAELKVDPELFSKVAEGTAQNVDEANKYFYCLTTNLKLVDDFGHVIVDKVANILGENQFMEEFKQALHKCNEVIKENPFETLASIHRCYFETSPVIFDF